MILQEKLQNGFIFETCVIEYIVLWEDKELKKSLKHPLCKIVMKKRAS
jgi:ATP-dependent DNA helicase RecQ